jgi:hypothetical protein
MIIWRDGKAGFVGAGKHIIMGVIKAVYSVAIASVGRVFCPAHISNRVSVTLSENIDKLHNANIDKLHEAEKCL